MHSVPLVHIITTSPASPLPLTVCTILLFSMYHFISVGLLGPALLLTSDIIKQRLGAAALDR